jgi:hypothetical protein
MLDSHAMAAAGAAIDGRILPLEALADRELATAIEDPA